MVKRLLFVAFVFATLVGLNQVRHFWLAGGKGESISVTIKEGFDGYATARTLKEQGVIPSVFWFRVYLRLDGASKEIQVGTFELQKGMNYREVVKRLGKSFQEEVVITVPEGMTLDETYTRINASLPIERDEWDRVVAAGGPFETHPFVVYAKKPSTIDLEGYLFPETYHFFVTDTAEDVVRKMLDQMEKETAGLSLGEHKSFHEVLTLASIIEKEVRKPDTMRVVSGIFHNRLAIGMPLQADATVNYITGKDHASALIADTQIDSPYNTYKYPGLPPGPIAGSGMNAIRASIEPTKTDYFYYLTSPEGTIHYAKTFEEHVANRQYLR